MTYLTLRPTVYCLLAPIDKPQPLALRTYNGFAIRSRTHHVVLGTKPVVFSSQLFQLYLQVHPHWIFGSNSFSSDKIILRTMVQPSKTTQREVLEGRDAHTHTHAQTETQRYRDAETQRH